MTPPPPPSTLPHLPQAPAAAEPHLGHSRVDLQNLLMAFDLPHADFAGELGGGRAVSLQREGTVQGLLVAAPHLGEGELLRWQKRDIRNITQYTAMLTYALNEMIQLPVLHVATLSHAQPLAAHCKIKGKSWL